MRKSRREIEAESPIVFVPASNGEHPPAQPTARDEHAEHLFHRLSDEKARKLGISRREFAASACGAATALLVVNQVYGCGSSSSGNADAGKYDVDDASTLDAAKACEKIEGSEFIFDVQTHHVDPKGTWRQREPGMALFLASLPQAACGESDKVNCFGVDHYVREVFLRSDTAIACLSGVPALADRDPLGHAEREATRRIVDRLAGSQRLIVHASVRPNEGQAQLDAMPAIKEQMPVAAWKVYPSFGSWRLDDAAVGAPFIERARQTGVKVIAAHRGISDDAGGYDDFSSPKDIGAAAKAFPDVTFLAYHSGWEQRIVEGPYDAQNPRGLDRMIKTVLDNALGPNGNLYAELGSTWRGLMTKPLEAAHALGKLLKYLGEDRILFGSDCIWYGSPQEQIIALRTFQIPQALQDQYGYPPLTDQARKKIFGLNAARVYGIDPAAVRCKISEDDVSRLKSAALDLPPSRHLGPRTRREFFALLSRG